MSQPRTVWLERGALKLIPGLEDLDVELLFLITVLQLQYLKVPMLHDTAGSVDTTKPEKDSHG